MVGLMFTGTACSVFDNWWPFFTVVFYLLAPLPNFLVAEYTLRGMNQRESRALANFVTGTLIASGLALPGVLAHAGVIRWEAFLMCSLGGLIVFSTIIVYIRHFQRIDSLI
jgi:hypothetical protein